jgi:cell division protein FtsQ
VNSAPPSQKLRNVRKRVDSTAPASHAPGEAAPESATRLPSSIPPVSGDIGERPSKRGGDSGFVRALRVVVGVALVVGIGSGVAWGARRYVRTSPRFGVSEIITSGGKRRSPDDIASIAGISKGQNVFSIDLDKSRARLTADPWIESAELTRQLPSTISVRVTEREAAAIVALNEGSYLVTRDGAIIKRVESGDPVDFHIVTGVALKTLVDDREGTTRTIRQALDLAYDYERSPLAQRSPLQEVHVEPTGDMTLIVGKSGIVVRMGSAPYRRKLDQAVRIVGEVDRRGAKPDVIMLDDEARPDRVVVRMR